MESEFGREYAQEQIRRARHPFRRLIKSLYLRNILADVRGPAIDFGCGAGQLLDRLPAGSVGIEVNRHLIEELRRAGRTVFEAQARLEDFELRQVQEGQFKTLVIAHVLEHLPDPTTALQTLLLACRRVGVERVIAVLPGQKGFSSDPTHRTFVDRAYISANASSEIAGFQCSGISYFPGPWEWVGRYFVFHEMKVIFDRQTSYPADHA